MTRPKHRGNSRFKDPEFQREMALRRWAKKSPEERSRHMSNMAFIKHRRKDEVKW